MIEREGMKVAKRIRDGILRLQYRPGQNLDEAELSDVLNVSRTPVREAIILLIADGLVVRDGRKAKVASLDLDDVPKLYEALLISSRMIQRLAARNRTPENLKSIQESLKRFEKATKTSNGVERSEANLEFHSAISHAAGNKYFQTFYNQVLIDTLRLARACFSDQPLMLAVQDVSLTEHLAETIRQHRLIYAAIKNADAELADELAVLHHRLTTERLKKVLFSNTSDGSSAPNLEFVQTDENFPERYSASLTAYNLARKEEE
jgi:DNA-binding GntR family transcriptional regulator